MAFLQILVEPNLIINGGILSMLTGISVALRIHWRKMNRMHELHRINFYAFKNVIGKKLGSDLIEDFEREKGRMMADKNFVEPK